VDRTLSWLAGANSVDAVERALTEVDAAITMVAFGVARSVRLCNLPGAEEAAFDAAARAQAAAVAFSLQRDGPGSVTLIIGPRLVDGPHLERGPLDTDNSDVEAPA
jgi:hypothetical protein